MDVEAWLVLFMMSREEALKEFAIETGRILNQPFQLLPPTEIIQQRQDLLDSIYDRISIAENRIVIAGRVIALLHRFTPWVVRY